MSEQECKCRRCRTSHKKETCPVQKQMCHKCHRKNHFASWCQNKHDGSGSSDEIVTLEPHSQLLCSMARKSSARCVQQSRSERAALKVYSTLQAGAHQQNAEDVDQFKSEANCTVHNARGNWCEMYVSGSLCCGSRRHHSTIRKTDCWTSEPDEHKPQNGIKDWQTQRFTCSKSDIRICWHLWSSTRDSPWYGASSGWPKCNTQGRIQLLSAHQYQVIN